MSSHHLDGKVPVAAVVGDSPKADGVLAEVKMWVNEKKLVVKLIYNQGCVEQYIIRREDVVVGKTVPTTGEFEIHVKGFGALKFTPPAASFAHCEEMLRRVF